MICHGDPMIRNTRVPVRIVLAGELATAGVKLLASGFMRQGLEQEPTGGGIAWCHQPRHIPEVFARLLFCPRRGSGWKRLQPEGAVVSGMTDYATGMSGPLLREDRLHASAIRLKVEGLRRERGITFLFIEHDLDIVMNRSDRIVVMAEGRVIAEGAPEIIRRDARVLDAYLGGVAP